MELTGAERAPTRRHAHVGATCRRHEPLYRDPAGVTMRAQHWHQLLVRVPIRRLRRGSHESHVARTCPCRAGPPAVAPARRGKAAVATTYSPGILPLKAFYTPCTPRLYIAPPRRSSRTRRLRRTPLVSPRVNLTVVRSCRRFTARASPLDPT